MANALMYYMEHTGKPFKIRFVNRLDMDTSGLLVVAKNAYCQNDYTRQMKANLVQKALSGHRQRASLENGFTAPSTCRSGRPGSGERQARGVMEGGAPSVTHYTVLRALPAHAATRLVELLLETGRTHQIRVHMSHIGHPVLGDWLYGGVNIDLIERQALHAASLTFTHPITKEQLTLTAPVPEDMQNVLRRLK